MAFRHSARPSWNFASVGSLFPKVSPLGSLRVAFVQSLERQRDVAALRPSLIAEQALLLPRNKQFQRTAVPMSLWEDSWTQ